MAGIDTGNFVTPNNKISTEIATVTDKFQEQLEAQAQASANAQDAMTRTMHGMGAEFGTPAEQSLNMVPAAPRVGCGKPYIRSMGSK